MADQDHWLVQQLERRRRKALARHPTNQLSKNAYPVCFRISAEDAK
jgi:hypothetical protein